MAFFRQQGKANPFSAPHFQLLIIYFGIAIILGFGYLAATLLQLPIEHITGDPAMIYEAHPFTGLASNAGVLLWAATAAVCLFTFLVLKNINPVQTNFFLLFSGLITLLLCLDDLFMLHEAVFPWHLRVPQNIVYIIYAMITGAYFLYYLKHILQTEYILLYLAITLLGLSVIGDFILPQHGVSYFIEDALKFYGIGAWFLYFVRYSYKQFDVIQQS